MPSTTSYDIDDYEPLLVALQNGLGVVVPESQRSYLRERLEPLLAGYSLDSLSALASSLQKKETDEIRSSVLEAISKGRSDWSISPVLSNVLQKYIFEELPDKARIWLVGCGEGQLAYTIAMEIAEYENKTGQTKNFQLFASDSSQNDIRHAESACYSEQQISRLNDGYKKLYASPAGADNNWVIKDKIRQRVQFSRCDLTEDFQSRGEMDLIICPDVLVYFSNDVKAGILQQFSSLLKPGGILLTGYNQAVTPFTDSFERVEHPAGVFYRQKK